VWFTYGAFYFCRSNISVAVPFLKSSVEDGGLGLSVDEVGYILGATKIAYALGQLLNGQLAEQLSPRKLLALGMLGTAALNVAFGFGTAFYFLLFVWACNGYSQSLGWTPCVRIMANWFPVRLRGKAVGLIGTGYLLSASVTWLVASYVADSFGWQSAFWVPSAMMTCSAIVMWLFLKESPQESETGKDIHQGDLPRAAGERRNPLWENFLLTITNPRLWLLGLSLGLLNATRYGFLDWGLSHLVDLNQATDEIGRAHV
jgi:sugar phosphate permease